MWGLKKSFDICLDENKNRKNPETIIKQCEQGHRKPLT